MKHKQYNFPKPLPVPANEKIIGWDSPDEAASREKEITKLLDKVKPPIAPKTKKPKKAKPNARKNIR